ncbi:MAG: hypothetical protein CL687_03620 [Candidatus Pelagibacter sp.]|nr:hypothetical protein [Candidatus Pelagibacter sp.]
MINFLDIYRQDKNLNLKILSSIKKTIKKGDYILGDNVRVFEDKFSRFVNSKYAIGCANGTDALYLALKSLKLPKNSEVIVPAMTWISTVLAVILNNLKPVLVDINNNNPLMDLKILKKKVTKKTKVILPVHLYGSVVEISKIKQIIKKKDIYIIDDAAQAHGAKDNLGNKVGSLADLTCFSFYPGKNLGCYGDGGAITTNNKKLYKKILKMRNLGSIIKHKHDEIGINSRLDTIQASILKAKLPNLNNLNKKRKLIASYYHKNISNQNVDKLEYSKHSVYHQYVIKVKKRAKLIKVFRQNKIQFGFHYPSSINQLRCFKHLFKGKKFQNSEKLAKYCISIPIDPFLKLKEVKKIVNSINSI